MALPVKLVVGVALVGWGFADYLFPEAVLRVQSDLLNCPPEPKDALARHKRRVGLVTILAGLIAVIVALG